MSKRPPRHNQKVAKGHGPKGPVSGLKQKPMWWSMCTCGWYQGFYNKQDALDDKKRHQEKN